MNTSILRKYFIMGSQNCSRNPEDILLEAIDAGITAFQYREKGPNSLEFNEKIELGKKLRQICLDHDIPFIINDNSELIDLLNVDGIHVGQNDISTDLLRKKHPNLLIGLSIGNEIELKQSNLETIDYIGVGPIYSTSSKADAGHAVGTKWIKKLKNEYPQLPIVGIGGITTENAHKVISAGADGVSVISAITQADDIKQTVNLL